MNSYSICFSQLCKIEQSLSKVALQCARALQCVLDLEFEEKAKHLNYINAYSICFSQLYKIE